MYTPAQIAEYRQGFYLRVCEAKDALAVQRVYITVARLMRAVP